MEVTFGCNRPRERPIPSSRLRMAILSAYAEGHELCPRTNVSPVAQDLHVLKHCCFVGFRHWWITLPSRFAFCPIWGKESKSTKEFTNAPSLCKI